MQKIMTVTPEVATDFLANNTNNRPLNAKLVKQYATDMKAGRWQFNGETIKVASNGTLLDGQHRLQAVYESEATVQMLVVTDLPLNAFETIDIGLKRSSGSILALQGHKNTSALASAARWLSVYETQRSANTKVTDQEIKDVIERHPLLVHYTNEIRRRKALPSSFITVACIGAEKYGQDRVQPFVQNMIDGVNLQKGNPILTLRERLMQSTLQNRIVSQAAFIYTLKAFKAFISNSQLFVLKIMKDESLPRI